MCLGYRRDIYAFLDIYATTTARPGAMGAHSNASISINGDTSFINNTCIDRGGENLNVRRFFNAKLVFTLQWVGKPDKVGHINPYHVVAWLHMRTVAYLVYFQSIDWDNKHSQPLKSKHSSFEIEHSDISRQQSVSPWCGALPVWYVAATCILVDGCG